MASRSLARCAAWIVTLTSLTSCGSPPTPNLHPASTQAVADLADAHQLYIAAVERGSRGDALVREMQAVLRLLEAANAKPPIQPLFLSVYADLLALDASQPVARLEFAQAQVLDLCSQWVPAYLAKARLALREGHVRTAMQHIEAGEEMLHEIETFEPQEFVSWFDPRGWFGLPFYDPTLPEAQRFQQMLAQLEGWFEWEDPLREPATAPLETSSTTAGSISSRLRARLLFEKLRIQEHDALTGPDEVRRAAYRRVITAIDRVVLALDAEFLDAELLRARYLLELGEFQDAESVLTGLTNPKRTRLANDPRVLLVLLDVYVRWLIETREKATGEPSVDQITLANVCDDKIADLGVRLGGIEGAGAVALVKIAEAGVVRSEWLEPKDANLHHACDRLLAAARNAIKAEGAHDLEPIANSLVERLEAVERARRYPNGVPARTRSAR